MFSLRNRSFPKETGVEPRELRHLLQLAGAVKIKTLLVATLGS